MASNDGWEPIRADLLRASGRAHVVPWWRDVGTIVSCQLATVVVSVIGWQLVEREQPDVRPLACVLLGASLVAALLAVRPGRLRTRLGVLAVVTAIGSAPVWLREPAGAHGFWASASCAAGEVLLAALPAVLTLFALSRFAASASHTLLGGAASSTSGLAVLDVTCPLRDATHVGVFHLAPAIAVVLFVLVVRKRVRPTTFSP